jgi:hypothetical protein
MSALIQYDKTARELRQSRTEPPVGTLDTKELIRLATLAASSHNTQPWKFKIRNQLITILPDFSRRCSVVDPDDSHLFKSLGCAAENMVHAAAAQGFAAEVRFDASENAIQVMLSRDEQAVATDLSRAIPLRQCVKTAYDGNPIKPHDMEALHKSGKSSRIRTIFLMSDEQKEAVIEFVTRGNIAQLSDRKFRSELISWIRFNPGEAIRKNDGLAGRTTSQPALPRWLAKLIIGFVLTPKGQARTDTANIRSSAGLAVFVSREQSKDAWVEAGRVFERFALQATALHIRTAFINQPIEVPEVRSQFESWLKLDREHAQLMIRFGYGEPAPFSLRRPVDDVIMSG